MAGPSVINDGGDNDNNRPLRKLAEAFKSLSNSIISTNDDNNNDFQNQENSLHELALACSLVYPLFHALGSIFRFAEIEYRSKVDDLVEASKSISTLQAMIDGEIESRSVRKGGSHTRNLLLVKRGLDMLRVLFEQIIATGGDSIVGPVSVAYAQVFGKHHNLVLQGFVAADLFFLPTKAQLLMKINEDEASGLTQMQIYIGASAAVILYIEKLFLSKDLDIDW